MELESLSEASASAFDEPEPMSDPAEPGDPSYDEPMFDPAELVEPVCVECGITQPVLVSECLLTRYVNKTYRDMGIQTNPDTAQVEEASLTRETLVVVDEESADLVSNGKLTCSHLQQRTGFYDMTPRTAPL